jgi:hypothetical protein
MCIILCNFVGENAHRGMGGQYRISCACGLAAPRWSVSVPSAIRFWNSIMATGEALSDEDENGRMAG